MTAKPMLPSPSTREKERERERMRCFEEKE